MDVYTHCMGMDGQEFGPLCMYKYILYAFCCTWILIFLSVHFKHEKGLDKSYYSDVYLNYLAYSQASNASLLKHLS